MQKIFILILACFLCGCATNLKTIEKKCAWPLTNGKNMVIGKIQFKGFEKVYKRINIKLLNKKTRKKFFINLNDSTYLQAIFPQDREGIIYFFLEIPAGEYEIKQIRIANLNVLSSKIKFVIHEDVRICYIGTLWLRQLEMPDYWGMQVSAESYVLDEYEEIVEEFKKKYPQIKENILIELMEKDY